jgi:hypothetical protein
MKEAVNCSLARNPIPRIDRNIPIRRSKDLDSLKLILVAVALFGTTLQAPLTAQGVKTAKPELSVRDFLLQDRHRLDLVKGAPMSVDPRENCISGEREYAYRDDTYVCVKNGIITLLGYNIQSSISSPSNALRAVGLEQSSEPIHVGSRTDVWMFERGNPLTVGDRSIPRVTLIGAFIEIDMHGWEKIQRKSLPQKNQTMLQQLVNLLGMYYPGLIDSANLDIGLVVTVKDRWATLSTDQRLSFVTAVHEGWSREGIAFGEKKNAEDEVIIKHSLSGRELATWTTFRGAHVVDEK